ncbi:MAG: nucleotidyltransferase family protein [Thiobacillus sp.]|uniref:nucleotidyltransferase domain-containing protein n=1 Tax=Thiobacillus sp. TaxID=924 RepID=UPI0028942182|nr:nucleotidyltransferase family protein [Thiobacillus sp.]MDT3705784.1 nucleotidyltransferase family protein [Thiobacillus sp.]
MRPATDLLSRTLRTPELAAQLSLAKWDLLVRQARQAGLLARLHARFDELGLSEAIPRLARWHFEAAAALAHKQQIAVRWEVCQIRDALAGLNGPLVVMKGAAYVMAGSPAAHGRLFNDIDILVPRRLLNQAEAALMLAGWHTTGLSAYDDRYYRRWMHEIPPMQHIRRATVIDVHHAILPDTARYFPDPEKLLGRAVPVADLPDVYVLAAEDRILHSAAHLFHDGELPHGLRDLTDLDLLLRHEAATAHFWPRLVTRATELQLGRPLFYALRYARHFLDTPVPGDVWEALRPVAPSPVLLRLVDGIFSRALAPSHASCSDALSPVARQAAYVRAHWLRMPSHLLLPHLFHKAFISPHQENGSPKAA